MVFTTIKNILSSIEDFLHEEQTATKMWWNWSVINVGILICSLLYDLKGGIQGNEHYIIK